MSPQTGWILQTQVVPRLRSAVPIAVNLVGSEDGEELVQDATAMAAKLMHNVEAAGKKVTPGNIAYYTIQHMRSGRRSTGSTVVDIMGTGTQLKGKTRLTSLDETAAINEENGGEIFQFHDVLSNGEDDPATKAARRLDWETFIDGLPQRERTLLEFMAEGKTLRHAAQALRLSDSTMQTAKRRLVSAIQEFMGPDILLEILRLPQWRSCLDATKEKMACRHERQR